MKSSRDINAFSNFTNLLFEFTFLNTFFRAVGIYLFRATVINISVDVPILLSFSSVLSRNHPSTTSATNNASKRENMFLLSWLSFFSENNLYVVIFFKCNNWLVCPLVPFATAYGVFKYPCVNRASEHTINCWAANGF